jgi:hypothetical protein
VSNEIVVALIAVSGVVLTQLVTYILGRQSRRDLRANIDREIDIVRKLRPASAEANKLEKHIKSCIDDLIWRDERREQLGDVGRNFGPIIVLGFAVGALGVWREHGVPKDFNVLVSSAYWGLAINFAVLVLQSVWKGARYAYWRVRLWMAKWKQWRSKRKLAKTEAAVAAIVKWGDDAVAQMRERIEWLLTQKQAIIDGAGVDAWSKAELAIADLEEQIAAKPEPPPPPEGKESWY